MKRLFAAVIASIGILGAAVQVSALPPAVILDDSYTPQNPRPIVSLLADEYADAEVTINDNHYTPAEKGPQRPIFDNTDPKFVYEKCPGCGQSSWRAVLKASYEENPICGHPVYFKGKACTRETNCGEVQVDEWIYSCSCPDE